MLGLQNCSNLVTDFSIFHSQLNYYSGLRFSVTEGSSETIFSTGKNVLKENKVIPFANGGRFDNLIGTFMSLIKGSKSVSGIGFEIRVNLLVRSLVSNRAKLMESIADVFVTSIGDMTSEKILFCRDLRLSKLKVSNLCFRLCILDNVLLLK